ncbi:MAG: hypothetical protein OEV49_14370 [candidate division Zixibacteria bacterium]|nr:hypothetical protein [candidate division Zixibacteria bacterium]MDH3939027.1 hypothetical protein [candidate division Zixibacteria bacterium]
MTVRLLKLCLIVMGALLTIHTGGPIWADDAAKSVEVFVDLDGDGFDDNESDVNKDGVPDQVVPVVVPKMLASAADVFGGQSTGLPFKPVLFSKSQSFGQRKFVTRSVCISRCSLTAGFMSNSGEDLVGSEACPGGNCGI